MRISIKCIIFVSDKKNDSTLLSLKPYLSKIMNTAFKTKTLANGNVLNIYRDNGVTIAPTNDFGIKLVGGNNFAGVVDEAKSSEHIQSIVSRDGVISKSFLKDNVAFTVYGYIHSGTTFSLNPFGCRFDSGIVGYIYMPKDEVRKVYNAKRVSKAVTNEVKIDMEDYIKRINAYMDGNLYYAVLEDGNEPICIGDNLLESEAVEIFNEMV